MGEFGKISSQSPHKAQTLDRRSAGVIQKEIAVLRRNVDSLREFLRGCQDSITAETAKLEKQCIGKIKSLEEERSNLKRKLDSAEEERCLLNRSLTESEQASLYSEKLAQNSHSEIAQLRTNVASLESALRLKTGQYESLLKDLEKNRLKCLELENKLAASNAYVQEQKVVFKEMLSDQKQLQASNTDLKMQITESDAYENALQEHVCELEGVCAILRDQLDEQQKYFLQKEMAIRKEGSERCGILLGEKKSLSNLIEKMKAEYEATREELEQEISSRQRAENVTKEKVEKIEELKKYGDELKSDLATEKSTVAMLTQKNNELSIKLARAQSDLRHLQDNLGDRSLKTDDVLNRKAMQEVQDAIQQYFDGQKKADGIIERELIASTNERLAEFERLLADERNLRLSAEIQLENLRTELKKHELESPRRHRRAKYNSPPRGQPMLMVDNGSYAPGCKITMDTHSSENPHKDDGHAFGEEQEPELHGTNEHGDGPITNRVTLSSNIAPPLDLRSVVRKSPSSTAGDSDSIASMSDDFLLSPRASQRLAEANRKALLLMNGLKN